MILKYNVDEEGIFVSSHVLLPMMSLIMNKNYAGL